MLSDSESSSESDKFLMRVLFCKIHCPSFICFCKPSQHIYSNGPLKLENTPNVPPKLISVPENDNNNNVIIKDQQDQIQLPENCLKSNLKKPNQDEKQKKTVQWLDVLGKELVQIKEFESCETDYFDYEVEEMNRSCICVIL